MGQHRDRLHGYAGSYRTPFAGKHHALHEYSWKLPIQGQTVKATVQWLFMTGRSHPLWAVTFDASASPPTPSPPTRARPTVTSRGTAAPALTSRAWAGAIMKKFLTTTKGPVTFVGLAWRNTKDNRVPYAIEWASAPDAEMGAVQTQTWEQHDAGGYWAYSSWGKSSPDTMPVDYNWTYQLNQYEIPFVHNSKRLAWGANFGAVGQRSYPSYGYGRNLVGYPYQSYSVFMVLGPHSAGPVAAQVSEVEKLEHVTLTASVGTVALKGPAGLARPDEAPYSPAGYDPILRGVDGGRRAGRRSQPRARGHRRAARQSAPARARLRLRSATRPRPP